VSWVNAVLQGVLLGGLYALFACGLSLMFGVMRIVNLAHGDFAVLAAFGAYTVMTVLGVNVGVAALIVVPLFAAVGYLIQRGLLQRSLSAGPYMIFIVVIGGVGSLEGPLLGTVVFFALQQLLADYGAWYLALLGAVAIAAAVWAPRGLWGLVTRSSGWHLFPVGYVVAPSRDR